MFSKNLLTISLLLPLAAISTTAYAGVTISDRRYWPSEAKSGGYPIGGLQSEANSAIVWDPTAPSVQSPREKAKAILRYHRR